jgi:hypothetical protein
VCSFKKGKASLQTEAIEILKRDSDIIGPTYSMQDHNEFYYISENLLVMNNTL